MKKTTELQTKIEDNAKVINKYIERTLFEKNSVLIYDVEKNYPVFIKLLQENQMVSDGFNEHSNDDSIYSVDISLSSTGMLIIAFKRQDWKCENISDIELNIEIEELNKETLQELYNITRKYAFKNSDEIYKNIQAEKRKKEIKKLMKKIIS